MAKAKPSEIRKHKKTSKWWRRNWLTWKPTMKKQTVEARMLRPTVKTIAEDWQLSHDFLIEYNQILLWLLAHGQWAKVLLWHSLHEHVQVPARKLKWKKGIKISNMWQKVPLRLFLDLQRVILITFTEKNFQKWLQKNKKKIRGRRHFIASFFQEISLTMFIYSSHYLRLSFILTDTVARTENYSNKLQITTRMNGKEKKTKEKWIKIDGEINKWQT